MFVKYNDKKQSSYIDSYQIGDDYIDIIFKIFVKTKRVIIFVKDKLCRIN